MQINYLATLLRKPGAVGQQTDRQSWLAPFISIHLPCYDEPADLVIETLNSLAALDYVRFEVIVLDNNTPDPETWKPVEARCKLLGPRFRFYHFDHVEGAKAGALNIGLELCSAQTRYVAVVDADYQVTPDFLDRAVDVLAGGDAAFVQFPQAYRNVAGNAAFIERELSDYFHTFAPHANSASSMLLTGTLSVIDIDALRAVGGWSGKTVTEDAELGVRFFESGYHGIYDPAVVGRGLLPMSYNALQAQRRRWATGNLQTLMGMIARRRLGIRSTGFSTLAAQLTAWPAFWLVPAASLALFALTGSLLPFANLIRDCAALTILAMAAAIVIRFAFDSELRACSARQIILVFFVKLSLVWVSSTAFFPVIFGRRIGFVRTPKFIDAFESMRLDTSALIGILGVVGMVAYALAGHWPAAIACLLIAAIAPSAIWVDRSLRAYAKAIASKPRGR